MANTIQPDLTKYYEICHIFHNTKIKEVWIDFGIFLDEIGNKAIIEATQKSKIYPPDGRFFNLLGFRYIDFLRQQKIIEPLAGNPSPIESLLPSEMKTPVKKAVTLIDDLIDEVSQGGLTKGQIGTKFRNIAKEFQITHFLGIPIDEIKAISKSNNSTKQNRSYHKIRFIESISRLPLLRNVDYADVDKSAADFCDLGLKARKKAKSLESDALKTNTNLFFTCFLLYLKSSILFKEAITIQDDFPIAKYNYAWVLKRLGCFSEAIACLEVILEHSQLPPSKTAMVLECIGDTYLLKKEYSKSIPFFEKGIQQLESKEDLLRDITFNLLEVYFDLDLPDKIEATLDSLIAINKPTLQFRQQLLNSIIGKYNDNIADKAYSIK